MKPLWNHLHLDRPPTSVWRSKLEDFDRSLFISTINKALEDMLCKDQLHTEAAVLSRLIYRMKSKFRTDKGLKSMEKINSTLLHYLKLSIEKDYKYLKANMECGERYAIIPSRQMVEYVLVRTQGFGKLMCRLESVARTAAHFLKNRINLGQAWTVSVIAYSIVSRIWLLAGYLLKRCCNWYNGLYAFLKQLKPVGVEWMPREHTLPSDLKAWIAVPWIDNPIQCPTESRIPNSIFNLIKANEDEESLETQEMEDPLEHSENLPIKSNSYANSDVGERVSRESPPGSTAHLEKSNRDNNSIGCMTETSKSNLNVIGLNVIPDLGEKLTQQSFADLVLDARKLHMNNNISTALKKNLKRKKSIKETGSSSAFDIDDDEELLRESATFQSKSPKTSKKPKCVLDKIKTQEGLLHLLQQNTYPGLDKLQWNMLKKRVNKAVRKLEKYPTTSTKSKLLVNKITCSIRDCISECT